MPFVYTSAGSTHLHTVRLFEVKSFFSSCFSVTTFVQSNLLLIHELYELLMRGTKSHSITAWWTYMFMFAATVKIAIRIFWGWVVQPPVNHSNICQFGGGCTSTMYSYKGIIAITAADFIEPTADSCLCFSAVPICGNIPILGHDIGLQCNLNMHYLSLKYNYYIFWSVV